MEKNSNIEKKSPTKLKIRIIKSATKKFAKHGFTNTSMDEIVQDAKVSKGSLFYHFDNKEKLFFAVLSQARELALKKTLETCSKKEYENLFGEKENLLDDLGKLYDAVAVGPKNLEKLWLEGLIESSRNSKLKDIIKKQEKESEIMFLEMVKQTRKKTGMLKGYDDDELAEFVTGLNSFNKGVVLDRISGKNPKEIRKGWIKINFAVHRLQK